MNWGQALIAMDIGEPVRYQGIRCIVVGVAARRKPVRNLETGEWSGSGDRYFGVDLIDSTGHIMQVRLSDILSESEYLISIKEREGENHGDTGEIRNSDPSVRTF